MVRSHSIAGSRILISVLFGVSLIDFLINRSYDLFLKDVPTSVLILSLFVFQCAFLKITLSISDPKKANSKLWLGLLRKSSILQPAIFSILFFSFQILLARLRGFEKLITLVEDPQGYAYYSLALMISDPLVYVREWLGVMQVPLLYWGGHVATHFPGYPLMIYSAFSLFGRNPESVIWLVAILSSLAIFPLFYLVRRVYGARVAALSCVLYTWIPSVSLNFPYMDLTVGLFILITVLFLLYSLRLKGGFTSSLLGGLTLSYAVSLTFVSAAATVLVLNLMIATENLKRGSLKLFAFLSGMFLPYVILELTLGLPFFEAALWAFRTNQWFYHHLHSLIPAVWNFETSVILFLFLLGFPVCMILIIGIFQSFRKADIFTLGLSAMMLVTVIFAKLELARVALFLVPFISISVAAVMCRNGLNCYKFRDVVMLSSAQFLQVIIVLSNLVLLSAILGYQVG